MSKCLTVVALVLLVLAGAMGLRNIAAPIGPGAPPQAILGIGPGAPPQAAILGIGPGAPPSAILGIGPGAPPAK